MSAHKLSNVPLDIYHDFLKKVGCKHIRTEGGHEVWVRSDLTRPIVVQTHESPVPEFIIRNALRNLGLTKKDFFNIVFGVSEKENPKKPGEMTEPILDDNDLCYCKSGKKYKDCHGKRE
jgi:predicted RNA binding protein YcfA (HicA-like mRNA interferase family)